MFRNTLVFPRRKRPVFSTDGYSNIKKKYGAEKLDNFENWPAYNYKKNLLMQILVVM